MSKNIEEKVLKRFRQFVIGFGCLAVPLGIHKLLCVYKPELARWLYFDRIFKNEEYLKIVLDKVVRIVLN
jgi:hypothetical protein